MVWCYLKFSDKYIIIIINLLHKKNYLKKIIKGKENLKKIEKIIENEKLS